MQNDILFEINEREEQFVNQNQIVLHGGAVLIGEKPILILAPRGSGKTSSIVYLIEKYNAVYLADDAIALDDKGVKGLTVPLKLRCLFDHMRYNGNLIRFDHSEEHAAAFLPSNYYRESASVKPFVLLFLKYADYDEIKQIKGQEKLLNLLVNMRKGGKYSENLPLIADFARRTPMYKITYSCFERLGEFIESKVL